MYINPIGTFIDAGFRADSGASGRKVTVDTYGGLIPQGDKSISGKDPSRVDRAARTWHAMRRATWSSKGLATSAMVSLVYSMGRAEPVHLSASGMGEKSRGAKMDLTELLKKTFDFRPEAIAERLIIPAGVSRDSQLRTFGRAGFPWEETAVV